MRNQGDEPGKGLEIIFHADDMGATPGVSRKILDAWQEGLIDGFSIIANGTGLELVSERLSALPGLEARISVHLNISDGRSLLPPEEVPGLVDRNGYFRYGFSAIFMRLCLCSPSTRRRLLREIEGEWREQIHRTREICGGREIRAVDGHIHVHVLPFLFRVAAGLAAEEGIPEIRVPREFWSSPGRLGRIFSFRFLVNQLKWTVLRVLSGRALGLKKRFGIGGPGAFVGVLNAGRMTEGAVLNSLKKVRKLGTDTCEVLFHIGGAPVEEVSEWRPLRPTFQFLISPDRRREYRELAGLRVGLGGGKSSDTPNVEENEG